MTGKGNPRGSVFRKKEDLRRFLYPDEWNKFISHTPTSMTFYFKFLLQTGMRHHEASYVEVRDIDMKRNFIKVRIAKTRRGGMKKIKITCDMCKEKINMSRTLRFCPLCGYKINNIDEILKQYISKVINRRREIRDVRISENFKNELQQRINEKHLNQTDTFNFPTIQGLRQSMHRILKQLEIKGWEDLSSHNLRKTHENYLIATGSNVLSMRMQMGHSLDIATSYYISNNLFTHEEIGMIKMILGNLRI